MIINELEEFDLPEVKEAWASVIDKFTDWKPVKVRILGKQMTGYSYWTIEPKRSHVSFTKPTDLSNIDEGKVIETRAFPVLDRSDNKVKVLAIKQIPLMKWLKDLYANESRGSFTKYDLEFLRKGTTKTDTKYFVTPTPPKPLTEEELELIKWYDVDLMAYFSWIEPVTENDAF